MMILSSRIGGMTLICQWKIGTRSSQDRFQVRIFRILVFSICGRAATMLDFPGEEFRGLNPNTEIGKDNFNFGNVLCKHFINLRSFYSTDK